MSPVVQRSSLICEGRWRPECVICRESLELEESKADEDGQAIHEECYVSKLIAKETTKEQSSMKLL